jgi:hypothetical protein
MGVAEVAGEKHHLRGQSVVVETVCRARSRCARRRSPVTPLGYERGDDGNAAVSAAKCRVRPRRTARSLELLLGEDRPDPCRERGGHLVLRYPEDARTRRCHVHAGRPEGRRYWRPSGRVLCV